MSLWSMRPIVIIALFIGGYLGRDEKVHRGSSGRRWMKDVDEFVKTCDVCQSTNGAKFMKTAVPLHPIPWSLLTWCWYYSS